MTLFSPHTASSFVQNSECVFAGGSGWEMRGARRRSNPTARIAATARVRSSAASSEELAVERGSGKFMAEPRQEPRPRVIAATRSPYQGTTSPTFEVSDSMCEIPTIRKTGRSRDPTVRAMIRSRRATAKFECGGVGNYDSARRLATWLAGMSPCFRSAVIPTGAGRTHAV